MSGPGLGNTVPGLVTNERCVHVWKIHFLSSGVPHTTGLYILYILKASVPRSVTVPEKFNTLSFKSHPKFSDLALDPNIPVSWPVLVRV